MHILLQEKGTALGIPPSFFTSARVKYRGIERWITPRSARDALVVFARQILFLPRGCARETAAGLSIGRRELLFPFLAFYDHANFAASTLRINRNEKKSMMGSRAQGSLNNSPTLRGFRVFLCFLGEVGGEILMGMMVYERWW